MAITEHVTGSSSISTTEWSLNNNSSTIATSTTAGAFQLYLDAAAVDFGDVFQLALYEKVRSGDTQRIVTRWNLTGILDELNWVSPVFMLLNGWDFTLQKLSGTNRTINWSIRKAA